MFIDTARKRRSCRLFTDGEIGEEKRALILEAGRLAPSAKGRKPVTLIPVDDAETIRSLVECRDSGTKALETATFLVIVAVSDAETWIEDGSLAALMMQLEAEDLDIGSCWVHVRNRFRGDVATADIVRDAVHVDSALSILCMIAFGIKQ